MRKSIMISGNDMNMHRFGSLCLEGVCERQGSGEWKVGEKLLMKQ